MLGATLRLPDMTARAPAFDPACTTSGSVFSMIPKRRIVLIFGLLTVCGSLALLYVRLGSHHPANYAHAKHSPRLRLPFQQQHFTRTNVTQRKYIPFHEANQMQQRPGFPTVKDKPVVVGNRPPMRSAQGQIPGKEQESVLRRGLEEPAYDRSQELEVPPNFPDSKLPRDTDSRDFVVRDRVGQGNVNNHNAAPEPEVHVGNHGDILQRHRGRPHVNHNPPGGLDNIRYDLDVKQQAGFVPRGNADAEAQREALVQRAKQQPSRDLENQRDVVEQRDAMDERNELHDEFPRKDPRYDPRLQLPRPGRHSNDNKISNEEDPNYDPRQFQDQNNQNKPPPEQSIQEQLMPDFQDQENQKLLRAFSDRSKFQNSRSALLEPVPFDPNSVLRPSHQDKPSHVDAQELHQGRPEPEPLPEDFQLPPENAMQIEQSPALGGNANPDRPEPVIQDDDDQQISMKKNEGVEGAANHQGNQEATAAAPQQEQDHDEHLQQQNAPSDSKSGGKAEGIARFFVYEPEFDHYGTLSIWYDQMMRVLAKHPARTLNPEEATLFFLGVDVACPSNWPHYTRDPPSVNFVQGTFQTCEEGRIDRLHEYLERAAHFKKGNIHVVFDFYGWTPPNKYYHSNPDVLFAAVSHEQHGGYRKDIDVAWPCMPILSALQKDSIDCSTPAKYMVTFKGTKDAEVRANLEKLHDPENGVFIKLTEFKSNINANMSLKHDTAREYADLMTNTDFGLVPRGDNLYSFRFLETMSVGAIPVVFSDRWVLPFSELLNYEEFSLHIPENKWESLIPTLQAISAEKRCEMRKAALHLYHAHFATIEAQLDSLLAIVALRRGLRLNF